MRFHLSDAQKADEAGLGPELFTDNRWSRLLIYLNKDLYASIIYNGFIKSIGS